MDWILNHLVFFIIAAGVAANAVQKFKRANLQKEARKSLDPESAERTRRVQEEIRRKIAQRGDRAGTVPPAMPSPPALPLPPVVIPPTLPPRPNIFEELARQMAEAKRLAEMRQRAAAEAEAGAQLRAEEEQKSRELAEARHLAEVQRAQENQQQQAVAAAYGGVGLKTAAVSTREKLIADLRGSASLRRAWLMREIIGKPVGLQ
jgi:hypothetical protein